LHTHFPEGFPDMNINPVSGEEMVSIISKLKFKNSSGYDGITNKLIKLSSQLISKPLTYIVNKSLIMGVNPRRLKYAVIKPVHKRGEKTDVSNYRTISIVTRFAKIFEMVIFRRLNDHVVTHKILSPQQYGFQKGLSTEDAFLN
jgi:hypothetical protein